MPVFIFMFVILAAAGTYALTTSSRSPDPAAQMNAVEATWFSAYVHAAESFSHDHSGFQGEILDSEIAPYMGQWNTLLGSGGTFAKNGIQYDAAVMNGNLYVWVSPPSNDGHVLAPGAKKQMPGDLSALFVRGTTTMVNPFDGQTLAVPY